MLDQIETTLLALLPVAFAGKTAVFTWISLQLLSEKPVSTLGKWINALFVATAMISALLTWLMWVLYQEVDATEVDWPLMSILLLLVTSFPFVVSACGAGLSISYRRALKRTRGGEA